MKLFQVDHEIEISVTVYVVAENEEAAMKVDMTEEINDALFLGDAGDARATAFLLDHAAVLDRLGDEEVASDDEDYDGLTIREAVELMNAPPGPPTEEKLMRAIGAPELF